jgi:hypothetical protein
VTVLFLRWLPIAALLTLIGFAFGWRAPVAVIAAYVLFFWRLRLERRGAPARNRLRSGLAAAASVTAAGAIGGVLFGGLGFIFAVFIAIALALPRVSRLY